MTTMIKHAKWSPIYIISMCIYVCMHACANTCGHATSEGYRKNPLDQQSNPGSYLASFPPLVSGLLPSKYRPPIIQHTPRRCAHTRWARTFYLGTCRSATITLSTGSWNGTHLRAHMLYLHANRNTPYLKVQAYIYVCPPAGNADRNAELRMRVCACVDVSSRGSPRKVARPGIGCFCARQSQE